MPHVEHQIESSRRTVFVAKRDDLDLQRHAFVEAAELLHDLMTQRVDCVLRGVDDQIGQLSNLIQRLPFGLDRGEQAFAFVGRVRTTASRKIDAEEPRPMPRKTRRTGRPRRLSFSSSSGNSERNCRSRMSITSAALWIAARPLSFGTNSRPNGCSMVNGRLSTQK